MDEVNYINRFKMTYDLHKDLEKSLLSIREAGATQMDSLKVIKLIFGLTIKEADSLVSNSKTWADKQSFNMDFKSKFANFSSKKDPL